jgi:hypothetical protein
VTAEVARVLAAFLRSHGRADEADALERELGDVPLAPHGRAAHIA